MAVYLVVQMKLWRRCLQGDWHMIRTSIAITMAIMGKAIAAEKISIVVQEMEEDLNIKGFEEPRNAAPFYLYYEIRIFWSQYFALSH